MVYKIAPNYKKNFAKMPVLGKDLKLFTNYPIDTCW